MCQVYGIQRDKRHMHVSRFWTRQSHFTQMVLFFAYTSYEVYWKTHSNEICKLCSAHYMYVSTPDIVISNLFLKWLDVINFFKFCKNQINRNISFKYGIYFAYFQTDYYKLCNRHTKYGDIYKFEKEICRYVFYFFYQIIFFWKYTHKYFH